MANRDDNSSHKLQDILKTYVQHGTQIGNNFSTFCSVLKESTSGGAQVKIEKIRKLQEELVKDSEAIMTMTQRFHQKIKSNLKSQQNQEGVLQHAETDYTQCFQSCRQIDVKALTDLLQSDIAQWQNNSEQSKKSQAMINDNINKFLMEHHAQLEKFLFQQQQMLQLPGSADPDSHTQPHTPRPESSEKFDRDCKEQFDENLQTPQLEPESRLVKQPTLDQQWTPDLTHMTCFGDPSLSVTKEWPSLEDVKDFPPSKKIKICAIGFKRSGKNEPCTGFSMEFTNGVKTPLFQTQNAKCHQFEKCGVDWSRKIVKVSMFVSNTAYKYLQGLRMTDESGKHVVDLTWYYNQQGQWHSQEIPEGKEIIGMYCNTSQSETFIFQLGFILWTPPQISE